MLPRQKLSYMTKNNSACASAMQFTSSFYPTPHKIYLLFLLLQHSTRYNLYTYVDATWWRLHVKSKTPISIFRTLETYWKILWWWRTNACFIAESVLAIANLRADIRTKDWWGIWYEIGYVMIFFLYSGTVWYIYIYIYIIYVWKLNQTVLELDFRAVKFVFFPRRDLNPHHWYTAAPFA